MNPRERVKKALNHEVTDRVSIDLGSTVVSSIHVAAYIKLREELGLEEKMIRASDPLLLTTDILNPVQISANGMDPKVLKEKFGQDIVFWGGGCDPQYSMPHKSANEVYQETKVNAEILSQNGGFIGGNVHNVQYDVPPENLIAELQALRDTVP